VVCQADIALLRKTPLFAALREEVFDRLAGVVVAQAYRARQPLFRQGDKATCMFVVLEGWVKYFHTNRSGLETVIDVVSTGRVFGETLAPVGGVYEGSADAATNARVARLPAGALREALTESREMVDAVLRLSNDGATSLIRTFQRFHHQGIDERLARLILSLSPMREGRAAFSLPYAKSLIADQLGVDKATISRSFRRLRDQGVYIDKRDVTIEDVARLERELAHGSGALHNNARAARSVAPG
jgi:CRP/FNR family transcriptional regulator, dissimilatory nitrate respiration regulator